MSQKTKRFGQHVVAFYGRVNDQPLKPKITFDATAPLDDPTLGTEWLSPREAENLARQLLKAAAYLRGKT